MKSDSESKAEDDEELLSSDDSVDDGDEVEPKFQLCAGLSEDCDRLAALVRDELTIQALFDGWKELRFHRVYMGRRFFTELLEFTEEALVIARDLWLDGGKDIRTQASYFLVLAGLYIRQPFTEPSKPARIRLTSKHVDLVSAFIDGCDANNFHDCVRLLDALFSQGALDLVAYPREFGLERNTLAYLRRDSLKRTLPSVKGPILHDLPAVTELRTALAEYCAIKRGLVNAPSFVTSERLNKLVPQGQESAQESDDDGDEDWKPDAEELEKEDDSIAKRRQMLRERAFATAAPKQVSVVEMKQEMEEAVPEEPPPKKQKKQGNQRPRMQKIKTFY